MIKRFLQHYFHREFSFVQARLSPEGLFGLHLTIGTLALVGAAWLFGGIAEDLITGDPLILVDELISEWFRLHATPRFSTGMHFVSALGSTATVSILAALMGCVFLWKRLWYWLSGLVSVLAGGMLLNATVADYCPATTQIAFAFGQCGGDFSTLKPSALIDSSKCLATMLSRS